MNCAILALFLTLTQLQPVFLSLRTCTNPNKFSFLQRDKQITWPAVVEKLSDKGLVQCARECMLRAICKSFSFEYVSGDCSLFQNSTDDAIISDKPGTDVSNVKDWPARLAGQCENHECSMNEVCQVTHDSEKICVIAHCPTPTPVNHATPDFTVNYETTKVGNRLSHTCDVNFRPVGEKICQVNGTWSDFRCEVAYQNCDHVMSLGGNTSGVYRVYPGNTETPMHVYCDQENDGGGWLVIQRRFDGHQDFDKTWNEYKDGFGDINNEFWLGNANIHLLTSQSQYRLWVELYRPNENCSFASYNLFHVGSEEENFKLTVGEFNGDFGNGLHYHNGCSFSTKDRDLDGNPSVDCADKFTGGWWYNDCYWTNPNSVYSSMTWYSDPSFYTLLNRTVYKIKPIG